MKELPIPPAAVGSSSARELARVWAADGNQHVSLEVGVWEDPAAWGLFLVDLARHVSVAYQQTQGLDPSSTLERIRAALDAEWGAPTDSPAGGVMP